MSNQGKDHRSQSPATQASRPASALPATPAQPELPPGQLPPIGAVTRIAQPPAPPEPANPVLAKTADAQAPVSIQSQPLAGDVVWFWEGVSNGEGALRSINAMLDYQGADGQWALKLFRTGFTTISQCSKAEQSESPQAGCWTARKAEWQKAQHRAEGFVNPHLVALERIKAEKTQRLAEAAAVAAS